MDRVPGAHRSCSPKIFKSIKPKIRTDRVPGTHGPCAYCSPCFCEKLCVCSFSLITNIFQSTKFNLNYFTHTYIILKTMYYITLFYSNGLSFIRFKLAFHSKSLFNTSQHKNHASTSHFGHNITNLNHMHTKFLNTTILESKSTEMLLKRLLRVPRRGCLE